MAIVFRFRSWDITNDCFRDSQRWATAQAIKRVMGEAIGEGVELDDRFLGRDVDGMTERGFDAHHPPSGGFQARVR